MKNMLLSPGARRKNQKEGSGIDDCRCPSHGLSPGTPPAISFKAACQEGSQKFLENSTENPSR